MSILSLPLALIQKISVGSVDFSASYLFIATVLGWILLRALLRMPKGGHRGPAAIVAAPACFILLAAFYLVINGFDASLMTAVLFWGMFTYLGMQFDKVYMQRFNRMMSRLAVQTSVIGLVLYALNIPLIDLKMSGSDQYFVDGWGHYRASSVFLNPNSFGYFLVFYIAVRLFGARQTARLDWLSSLCVLVALFLSGSRSALVALGFLVMLRVMLTLRPRVRSSLLVVSNILLMTTLLVLVMLASNFVGKDIRFEKWAFSLEIFTKQLEYVFIGLPENRPLEYLGLHFSDNMFLTLLFKFGAVGFAIFVAYYLLILYCAICHLTKGNVETHPFAAYVLATTVLFFYSNFLSFYPMVLMHGVAAGVLLGRRFAPATSSLTCFKAA